jgi:hypothetical protein
MTKPPNEIAGIRRAEPRRRMSKQQALRHLIHSAVRMIAAREDPFAIHLVVQSADKLLIDLSKKLGKTLALEWADNIKEEYRGPLIAVFRETYNFLKHANTDHDEMLHVGSIAESNILQLAVACANYHSLFGEWTDHMKLLFNFAKLVMPDGFVLEADRPVFDAVTPKLADMRFEEFFNLELWDDLMVTPAFPNLVRERDEDLRDNTEFFGTTFRQFAVRGKK